MRLNVAVLVLVLAIVPPLYAVDGCEVTCSEFVDTAECIGGRHGTMADCQVTSNCIWQRSTNGGWYLNCSYYCTGSTCYEV